MQSNLKGGHQHSGGRGFTARAPLPLCKQLVCAAFVGLTGRMQLAWLLHQGKADVAFTEDSDTIAYGCHTVRSSSSSTLSPTHPPNPSHRMHPLSPHTIHHHHMSLPLHGTLTKVCIEAPA